MNPSLFRTNKTEFIKNIDDNIKTENDIDSLVKSIYEYDFFNGTKGKLYCMYTEAFNYYGENVYKLGMTQDIKHRMCCYATNFLDDCVFLATSKEYSNYLMAENILFHLLKEYRIKDNKEFFKCKVNIISKAFDDITNMNKKIIPLIYLDCYMKKIKAEIKSMIKTNVSNKSLVDIAPKIVKFKYDGLDKNNTYNVENILSDTFIRQFNGKLLVIYNLIYFLGITSLPKSNKEYTVDLNQIDMVKDVINKLGFDKPNDKATITKMQFIKNIEYAKKHCKLFIDCPNVEKLFSVKQVLGFVNSFLSKCGIVIRQTCTTRTINYDKFKVSLYYLKFINSIEEHITINA